MKVLVIADDFTGACDTGALLKQKGFNAISLPRIWGEGPVAGDYDALCINADSRALDPLEAYRRVNSLVKEYASEGVLVSKRIDSTLRGNLGKEIDGVLDGLAEGYRAVVVPASPRAGRVCVGGCVLVHGVPLEKTGAAQDPVTPVKGGNAAALIEAQTARKTAEIHLETVLAGAEAVAEKLKVIKERVIVIDAAMEEDIRTIAHGCAKASIPIVCVDPGEFTAKMAALIYGRKKAMDDWRNLLVIGSMSQVSREQIDCLKAQGDTLVYKVDGQGLMNDPMAEAERAENCFRSEGVECRNLCITTAYSPKIDFGRAAGGKDAGEPEKIAEALAAVAKKILEDHPADFGLVYLCGGDTARAFACQTGIKGLRIIGELIPLAVYSVAYGGSVSGMKLITKGGMIGGREALKNMLEAVGAATRISQQQEEEK